MNVKKSSLTLSKVPKYLTIATTEEELKNIWELRNNEYSKLYPGVTAANDDEYDKDSYILFSKNDTGKIISTGRLVFDGKSGLPADKILKPEIDRLRQKGLKIAESSKLAISKDASGILPFYFFTYYEICIQRNIDSVIFITWNKRIPSYKKYVAAKVLVEDIGYSYGTKHTFSLLECPIKKAAPTIMKYMGGQS